MMQTKKYILFAILPVFFSVAPAFAADTYVIDKAHSNVGFQVRHLFSKVIGKFTDFSGQIEYDEADPEKSVVEVTIDTPSINTSNDQRDNHLKTPDFFDVKKFPTMTFKSKSVKKTADGKFDVTGDFTMHGVTKEVVLQVELLGKGPGPDGGVISGWEGKTSLKRSEYGLSWAKVVEGTQLVGDEIEIDLHIEADKK